MVAIYSTLGLAGTLAGAVSQDLLAAGVLLCMLLILATIVMAVTASATLRREIRDPASVDSGLRRDTQQQVQYRQQYGRPLQDDRDTPNLLAPPASVETPYPGLFMNLRVEGKVGG